MGIDDINKIRILFNDCSEKVCDIIINSFIYLSEQDIDETQKFLQCLYEIKTFFPDFKIEFDENAEHSNFDAKKICLNTDNVITFFHELTHVIHYIKKNSNTPDEFFKLKLQITNDDDFVSRCIEVVNYVENKKIQELFTLVFANKSISINSDSYNTGDYYIYDDILKQLSNKMSPKYKAYIALLDIIDALVGGISFDQGMIFIRDNNSYSKKSSPASGHGSEYYNKSVNKAFMEIIANYSSIRNTPFRDDIFLMLRYCCGDEFVAFLEEYYVDLTESIVQKQNYGNLKK